MIKAQTIIEQMQLVLPTKTSLFSNANITLSSLSYSGGIVTGTTVLPHGLQSGNYITIANAKTPIDVTSITFTANPGISAVGGIVTVITATNHDYTEGFGYTCEIVGATPSDYNGVFNIINVPNRRTFTYAILTNPSSATGSIQVLNVNANGYNGYQQIIVTSATTFTYSTTLVLGTPAQGTCVARSGFRISGAISVDRIKQAYTAQGAAKAWAFVVLGDNIASKDRNVSTDAVNTLGPGDEYRQRMISPFSVYVFLPCVDEIAGRNVRDTMEDVRIALYRTLLRVRFESVLVEADVYSCTANGDRYIDYTGAYYIHEFMFETVCDITIGDTVDPSENVAFRNLNLYFENPNETDGDDIIMETVDVDLDDVPFS